MKASELLIWIDFFISDAAKDSVAVRKIARIKALTAIKKQIQSLPEKTDITADVLNTLNISNYMKDKILKLEGEPPNTALIDKLANIHGLGYIKATQLLKEHNISKISDLKKKSIYNTLPVETQTWLKYSPLDKIPRQLIDRVKSIMPRGDMFKWEIAGSYRRNKEFSSDIDIVLVGDITSFIKLIPVDKHIYSIGIDKASLLIKINHKYVKMDIMKTTPTEYPFQLLYLTGSREHNIKMRKIAKAKGLLLNQRGLFKDGKSIKLMTEQSIFKQLNMRYVEPNQR